MTQQMPPKSTGQECKMQKGSMARDLGSFVAGVEYAQLPPEVVEFAKSLILKTVAGVLAGMSCPNTRKLLDDIQARALRGEVSILGTGLRTSAWEGVLLNAFAAHASELEDVAIPDGGCSWDVTVIPLLLTLAEKNSMSGKALIEATVAGLEAHYRTCLPFDVMRLGQSLPTTSGMGCAAAAAKAYGLDAEQTTAAMGFALSGPAITEASLGTDAHFLESALHSLQGMMGADMARMGLTSNPDLASYKDMLSKGISLDDAMANLGTHWFFREMWVKKYPNSISIHRQLDALFEIMAAERLASDDIETVEIIAGAEDAGCDNPNPVSAGEKQFSFQHALGLAILNGELSVSDFLDGEVDEPRLLEARGKVRVTIEAVGKSSEPVRYMSRPTTVIVRTKNGETFTKERMAVIGSVDEPMTRAQFNAVFEQFAKHHLAPENIRAFQDTIWALEEVADMSVALGALAPGAQ
ncbi:MmgE/PrpD family protein [Ponticoccus litoralis]|uniref:MmgE/PrpD family protein n=1 Tax=Ponticoccus litoralis TaxID=422297 RepID=A0AAW9SNC9_9RHOB